MLHGGLVSITFRRLNPEQVVELVRETPLTHLEWGGDVHCPHGDLGAARRAAELSRGAGLTPWIYGSYYRVGVDEDRGLRFADVLESARSLGVRSVRVWAGDLGSDHADDAHWERVVRDARRIADRAARDGLGLVFEYHNGTLTDTHAHALRLLHAVDRPNVRLGWQPVPTRSHDQNRRDLADLIDRDALGCVHAFHWTAGDDGVTRHPLADGEAQWRDYLAPLADFVGGPDPRELAVLLEFVRGDRPEQFRADAEALARWLGEA